MLAVAVLWARRQPLIVAVLVPRLLLVVVGVVLGFPLLTAYALQNVNSAHAAVVSGLLPVATAGMAVIRAGERPSPRYWIALAVGVATVAAFAVVAGAGRPRMGDILVSVAVALAGLGYAEGGSLARRYGGWRVICWALVLALPLSIPVTVVAVALHVPHDPSVAAWSGVAYVSGVSMFLGFFAWYEGLARGGVAQIGRLQLAQPVLTLGWSALLLGEPLTLPTALAAVLVLGSVAFGRKARGSAPMPGGETPAPRFLSPPGSDDLR